MDETISNNSGTNMSRGSSFERALASSTFSEPSKHTSVFSAFGDGDCGEPLETHHIHLDFTPTSDDDDFSQRKCCEFWKYITSRRDLHGMMVQPEIMRATTTSTDAGGAKSRPCLPEHEAKPKTAVSMLQIVEEKGLIDRAFEVKMQQSRCSFGSQEYELGLKMEQTKCPCPEPCLKCPKVQASVKAFCDELGAWDARHPKSMEPPGHPPSICSPTASYEAKSKHLAQHLSLDDPDAEPSTWVCPRSMSSAFECICKEGYHYDEELKKCVMSDDCTEVQLRE